MAVPLIVVAVIAIVAFSWVNGDRDRLVVRSVVFGGFFLSTIFHEWAHSLVAFFGGDREIRARGFLTWNVFRYMDPVLSVGMPLLFVMLGGLPLMGARTMVDHGALRSRWWSTFMSLAGPGTNLLLAIIIVAVLRAGLLSEESPVAWGLAFLCVLQITTSMFNLLPIPGFDGFGAFLPHLSHETQVRAMAFSRVSFFLVLAVMWTSPEASGAFWDEVYRVAEALHVPSYEWYQGWSLSRLR
ncbi:MAG: site-2 protease family protein [Dehalococcoidia bacterium]